MGRLLPKAATVPPLFAPSRHPPRPQGDNLRAFLLTSLLTERQSSAFPLGVASSNMPNDCASKERPPLKSLLT
jgi:hypothetical protein